MAVRTKLRKDIAQGAYITSEGGYKPKTGKWTIWAGWTEGGRRYVYSFVVGMPEYVDFYSASNTAFTFGRKVDAVKEARKLVHEGTLPGDVYVWVRKGQNYYQVQKGTRGNPPIRKHSTTEMKRELKRRGNPDYARRESQLERIYRAADKREAEGRRLAKLNEPRIREQMRDVDRFQPTWAMKNMIRALGLHSWQNTVADWQRLYEAKYILRLRRSRSRKR
jgi:hypothetical protein